MLQRGLIMDYLPILLVAFLALNNKDGFNIKDLISSLSEEDILAITQTLNLDENISSAVLQIAPAFLNGEVDFSKIAKSALPLLFTAFNKTTKNEEYETQNLEEIKEVASDEILCSLKEYFA